MNRLDLLEKLARAVPPQPVFVYAWGTRAGDDYVKARKRLAAACDPITILALVRLARAAARVEQWGWGSDAPPECIRDFKDFRAVVSDLVGGDS